MRKFSAELLEKIFEGRAKVLTLFHAFSVATSEFEYGLIERIFGSNDKNYMECSIKKLRDRLVHRVNENVLRVIIERYDNINNDLNEFIALFNI